MSELNEQTELQPTKLPTYRIIMNIRWNITRRMHYIVLLIG